MHNQPSNLWDKRHFKSKNFLFSERKDKVSDVFVGWRWVDRKSGTYKQSLVPALAKRTGRVPARRNFAVKSHFSPSVFGR